MEPLTGDPITRARIASDLAELGLRAGDIVLVHTSLRALGWVCGGPVAVVQALLDVLGAGGTLMVPAHSGENSDPKDWVNPPVPESWWPVIRAEMPAYDPAITPSYKVGIVPETVRTWPGALRSAHPQMSFAAIGPAAQSLLANHELSSQLGEESPLGALERAGGKVLLLGAGYGSCTTFHLAEYRVPDPPRFEFGAAMDTASGRQWVTFTDVKVDSDDFEALGAAYEATGAVLTGKVGDADCRLLDARSAVVFAVEWLPANRSGAQAGSVALGG